MNDYMPISNEDAVSEQMNIAIVGHVDHGKSTVIGRLLADTHSLPKGKLEEVKKNCELNAKPFEYAFLLDALIDEQSQGITIDSARCFFKTAQRRYIIIDAPGHIEFLKNMVSGASRAEAVLLVIDANEGVKENSRRHGYMVSFLGIQQIVVLVNKMDLVGYDEQAFINIRKEYLKFLKQINVKPRSFVPISAREGENIITLSPRMKWYDRYTVIEEIDAFEKDRVRENSPFRFPVQDIYKFAEAGDDRRIVAGTVEAGTITEGEEVLFLPSNKKSKIKSIEQFNSPQLSQVGAGHAAGFTLTTEIYVRPGEIMCRPREPLPHIGTSFRANIFWMGHKPMVMNRKYKLRSMTNKTAGYLTRILNVLDASDLTTEYNKPQVDRHDVADCVLQTLKPIAFDFYHEFVPTGRFVIIDDYEIAGGGIITEKIETDHTLIDNYVRKREYAWTKSAITGVYRSVRFNHKPKFIVITGGKLSFQQEIAVAIEEYLFKKGKNVYYLGLSNILSSFKLASNTDVEDREEHVYRLGELAHIFQDAGMILITTIDELDDFEIEILQTLNTPNEMLVISVGSNASNNYAAVLTIGEDDDLTTATDKVKKMLHEKEILLEYYL